PHCKITRGFQVTSRVTQHISAGPYRSPGQEDFHSPVTYWFRCPVCKAYKQWLVYVLTFKSKKKEDGSQISVDRYFKVPSIPSEGLEEIEELPEEPPALRTAYRQAVRAMDANAHLAAAAMFRRAVQIITRDLLGARHGTLANELNQVVGKTYNGATIT